MIPVPDLDPVEAAFPTTALQILPPMSEIPDSFKPYGFVGIGGKTLYTCPNGAEPAAKWLDLVSTWFFRGLKNTNWTPKPGVDKNKALRAVAACMGDWSPSQEHKEAGCAFLLSEWFEDVTYTAAK
jgi:hypothetical protein